MAQVSFFTCTQEAYNIARNNGVGNANGLVSGALYFTTDTKRLFRENVLYGGSFEYLQTVENKTGVADTLYFDASDDTLKIWNGEAFVTKFSSDATLSANVDAAISAAINTLDFSEVGGTNKVITTISQTNGIISATADNLPTSAVIRVATTNVAGATAEAALEDLGSKIATINGPSGAVGSFRAGDAALSAAIGGEFNSENTVSAAISAAIDAAKLKIVKAETVTNSANASEYYLADKDGNKIAGSDTIEILKDQFLTGVEFVSADDDVIEPGTSGRVNDYIKFTFALSGGDYKDIELPVSSFHQEFTEGEGITLNDDRGTDDAISIGIKLSQQGDTNSYLDFDDNGSLRIHGINTAIDNAKTELTGMLGGEYTNNYTVSGEIQTVSGALTAISGAIGAGFGSDQNSPSGTVVDYIDDSIASLETNIDNELSGKLDDVTGAISGEIIVSDGNNKVESSGKAIGGATLAATPDSNTVATEAAVKTYVDNALTGALVWNTLS